MTPLQKYQLDLSLPDFQADPSQARAIAALDKLYGDLMSFKVSRFLDFVFKPKALSGIYLWGSVGAGKTYLMDTFYECLDFPEKKREHFHVFMRGVYEQLKQLQGETDPLKKLAKQMRKKIRVLCFDEFFVKDIADAMLLGRLFTALFDEGIILVATSNVKLNDLYKEGLQRERFLPAIEILKTRLTEIEVGNHVDYRRQNKEPKTASQMQRYFSHYAHQAKGSDRALTVNDRMLQPISYSDGVLWVSFEEMCNQPRNAADYLWISNQFHTVILDSIPALTDKQLNAVIRFINLVDVFYDEKIRLVIPADHSIETFYIGEQAAAEFKRTVSRLHEMCDGQDTHFST
jgi:cell division protein ZapE